MTLWGLPLYRKTTFLATDRGLGKFLLEDTPFPGANLASYERITSHACRHLFARGSYGSTGVLPIMPTWTAAREKCTSLTFPR